MGRHLPEVIMEITLTAVFQKVPQGYIGFVEELPGANTQGVTLEEARSNLEEAIVLVLEANRTLSEERIQGNEVIREPLFMSTK
jgi:predicted RNase H-like HicB family nuclease